MFFENSSHNTFWSYFFPFPTSPKPSFTFLITQLHILSWSNKQNMDSSLWWLITPDHGTFPAVWLMYPLPSVTPYNTDFPSPQMYMLWKASWGGSMPTFPPLCLYFFFCLKLVQKTSKQLVKVRDKLRASALCSVLQYSA